MKKILTISFLTLALGSNLLFAEEKIHKGIVLETLDVGESTYVKFLENKVTYWATIPKTNLKKGDTITMKESVWMKNFRSEGLNKSAEKVALNETTNKN